MAEPEHVRKARRYLWASGFVAGITGGVLASHGQYGAAVFELVLGVSLYRIGMRIINARPRPRAPDKPRLVIRNDGRVCVVRSNRRWHQTIFTACGEADRPREALATDVVTCIGCLAAR